MSEPVEGRRLPRWRTIRYKLVLIVAALLVAAGYWIARAIRQWGDNWKDENIGPTVVGTVVFVGVVVGLVVALSMFFEMLREWVVESACPACAARRQRSFTSHRGLPTACGACTAYLRASGSRVREESLDAVEIWHTPYKVTAERANNRARFTFPRMCALCGSPDIVAGRKIRLPPSVPTWGGEKVMAAIAAEVAQEAVAYHRPLHRGHAASVANRGSSERQEAEARRVAGEAADARDDELHAIKVPVCAEHTADEAPMGNALIHNEGTLEFASYRYYKAFVEANDIR